jgi:nicotinate dehydrogenase subunit B
MAPKMPLSRREFVKDAGGLLIGFSLVDATMLPRLLAAPADDAVLVPTPGRLDGWLRIQPDETIRVFTGKAEIGMGVQTALSQIVAEELDAPFEHISFVMADTAITPDQGGVGGSTSVAQGGKPLRNAAATARLVLLQLASQRLGVPVEQLQVKNGIVSVKGDAAKSVSYGALAGSPDLHEVLKTTGDGFGLNVEGAGKPKAPSTYTVVGQPIPRVDMRPKVLGQFSYVGDVRVPGMLHGRVVRPAGVGSTLQGVDESSIKQIPGIVKVVVKGNFVGVVAQTEWAAIRAAQTLKVSWTAPKAAFPEQADLYQHLRTTTPKASKDGVVRGDAAAAMSGAAKKLQASYDWPFQSHATMGPGCAIADVRPEGVTTIWSGGQKPHSLQKAIAELLHVPLERARIVWVEDAGSYGRPGYDDAAGDAVMLSQAVGKPVRVQWMRSDMTAWGAKGNPVAFDLAGGLDADGKVTAFQFTSHALSGTEITPQPVTAGNLLACQLTGIDNAAAALEFAQFGEASTEYEFPNVHATAHVTPTFDPVASPLRTTHLRDPNGPATAFAIESFMDEMASSAGTDPIEFRLKHISDPRAKAVLAAAAEKAGWDKRPSPKPNATAAELVTGRGVGLGVRNGTYVATIAEVEVNRKTGAMHVKRLVCAHDCGLIINPDGLRGVIGANLMHSMSRAIKEEVKFDRSQVTSVDWVSYPVVRASDVPDQVDIVLINHPELPAGGAGEPSSRPTAGAIANAIFDATGVRVRQAPMTPARIKAAIASKV